MRRTQILLDEEQFLALQSRAARARRSVPELLREIVAAYLAYEPPPEQILAGKFALFDDSDDRSLPDDETDPGKATTKG